MNKALLLLDSGEQHLITSIKEATELAGSQKAILYALNPIHAFNYNKANANTQNSEPPLKSNPDANEPIEVISKTTEKNKINNKPGRKPKNK